MIVSPDSPLMQIDALNGVAGVVAPEATVMDVWAEVIAPLSVVDCFAKRNRYFICVPGEVGDVLGQNPPKVRQLKNAKFGPPPYPRVGTGRLLFVRPLLSISE